MLCHTKNVIPKPILIGICGLAHWILLIAGLLQLVACTKQPTRYMDKGYEEEKRRTEEKIKALYKASLDSIPLLLECCNPPKEDLQQLYLNRYIGRYMRDHSRYAEALEHHHRELSIANSLKDSAEIVQALNDVGVDFRRMGALVNASQYHYKALAIIDNIGKDDSTWVKNRVVSLNGLGNINLSLKYFKEAEANFKEALQGEEKLGSIVGKAINYANLGNLYQQQNKYKKAHGYYLLSLRQNILSQNLIGIGLCNTYLGELQEKQGRYEEAARYYWVAYQQMKDTDDIWHWLDVCIPMARISLLQGKLNDCKTYIDQALAKATQISSYEHLVSLYKLQSDYFLSINRPEEALSSLKKSNDIREEIDRINSKNRLMDVRIDYERNRSNREIVQLKEITKRQEKEKEAFMYSSWLTIGMLVVFILLIGYAYREGVKNNRLLKRMDNMRSDFFAGITHEFRTPITVILGLNEQLSHAADLSPSDIEKFRSVIHRQGAQLLELVNQLLDISKLRKGVATPEWRHGDIVMFMRILLEPFELYAENKGVKLNFSPTVESLSVDFVPAYLQKILTNLVSNAIKHTSQGDRITVHLEPAKSEQVLIRVQDSGEGIAKDDLERIFEPFFQSPSSRTKGGSGIGLSFTGTLVSNLNGKIRVTSEEGKGSCFYVSLPTQNTSIRQIKPWVEGETVLDDETVYMGIPEDEETDDERNLHESKPTVLLVEDNKDVGLVVKLLMEDKYNVVLAANGREGLEKARELIPDLIITDVMMPVMNGMEMCKAIKFDELLNHIPVVVLSALTSEEERIEGLRCGASDYLSKPFSADELKLRVDNIIAGRKKLKDQYAQKLRQGTVEELEKMTREAEQQRFLDKVNDFISQEMGNPSYSSATLSKQMHVSISQLNRKLSAVCGMTSAVYILHRKISHACDLLRETDKSIYEVGDLSGFSDPSYFSRMFKRHMDCTPSQYRQQISNSNSIQS